MAFHARSLFAVLLLVPRVVFALCPAERAPVRTAADAQAVQIRLTPLPATIESLHAMPMPPRPLPHDARIAPAETTTYTVTATLMGYQRTPFGDIQLVLSDSARRTILAVIPSAECIAASRFLASINDARADFARHYLVSDAFTEVRAPVEVRGVGFFDYLQGQRGLAPNGLSLDPVTAIDFTPSSRPAPPPQTGRRRSAGVGDPHACARPSLVLTSSRPAACNGDSVTITWQASDGAARVTIDGIGTALPASGSRVVTTTANAVYSGRAENACGVSNEALTLVTLQPGATAALSGPSSISAGSTTTLSASVSSVASWTMTSSLHNPIDPAAGTSSRTISYKGTTTGNDTITLRTAGGICGSPTATLFLSVSTPQNTGLRCCDGTRSASCFSCSNKQGCCSSHGGVCGCP